MHDAVTTALAAGSLKSPGTSPRFRISNPFTGLIAAPSIALPVNESRPTPVASNPPIGPGEAISQSVVARESSRATRLDRTLRTLLDLTRSNPPQNETQLDHLLATILDALMVATEAPMGNLQLFDPTSRSLRIRVHRGFASAFLTFFDSVHAGAACSVAFAKGAPEIVDDVATSPLFTPESRRAMLEARALSVQSLALIAGNRKLGVVSVHYRSQGVPVLQREAFASAAALIAQVVAAGMPERAER